MAHQVKLGVAEQQKKSFDAMISEFENSRLDTLKVRISPMEYLNSRVYKIHSIYVSMYSFLEQTFMKDYLHLEMLFHAKVLDFYTAAYKSIDDMHPEIDFAVLLLILSFSTL